MAVDSVIVSMTNGMSYLIGVSAWLNKGNLYEDVFVIQNAEVGDYVKNRDGSINYPSLHTHLGMMHIRNAKDDVYINPKMIVSIEIFNKS